MRSREVETISYGCARMTVLLNVSALDAFYGDFQALFGIDFDVREGEAVAVIGANGAGKSTLLKSLAGLVPNRAGDAIRLAGRDIGAAPAASIVRLGLALVPEGRQLLPSLTVEENLLIGAYWWRAHRAMGSLRGLQDVSGAAGAAAVSRHRTVRRPAADGRHRARADVEPVGAAVRRDQPRARADRGGRISTGCCRGSATTAPRSSWSSRISRGAARDRSILLPAGGPGDADGAVSGDTDQDTIRAAYFGT